jgi:lipoate---protein ligase
MATWRLIPPIQASGDFQMALDRWLFEQHVQGLYPPTLRFYTWEPIAISLGYHQRKIPEHWQTLTWNDAAIALVHRPTGGRAVLHQGDLTYGVVMSGVANSRRVAYQQVCEFLIQGWRSLGVELHYGNAGRGYIHNPNCFGTATAADLVLADGSKLIGSAQLRRGSTILQHGSIRLQQDAQLFKTIFGSDPQLPQLPSRFQTPAFAETLIAALTQSAQECFNAQFQVQPLSNEELTIITSLIVRP